MTEARLEQRPWLRAGLATVVIADLVSLHFFLDQARAAAAMAGLPSISFTEVVSYPPVSGAIVAVGVMSSAAFAMRPGRLWPGGVSLAALGLLATAHAQLYGSPWRHLYYSGLCLLGWLLGLGSARWRGAAGEESYARMGAIALLGAAYFNAGISKMAFSGLDWLSGLPIQAVIVTQDGLVADSSLTWLRSWIVETPAAAALLSILTVVFELAGPSMIIGQRVRRFVASGLVTMHSTIYLLTPILYWEAIVLLVLLGFSGDGRAGARMAPEETRFLSGRAFGATAALLATFAVVAIGHQTLRHLSSLEEKKDRALQEPSGGRGDLPATAPGTSAPPLPEPRRVGPFVAGQSLTPSWVVEDLIVTDDAIVVAVRGQAGRARFELTCRATHHSPFDLGTMRILYSQHVPFQALEAAGWELRRQVEQATRGSDACAALAAWRRASP